MWTAVEIYLAIICACAPALKPLFAKHLGADSAVGGLVSRGVGRLRRSIHSTSRSKNSSHPTGRSGSNTFSSSARDTKHDVTVNDPKDVEMHPAGRRHLSAAFPRFPDTQLGLDSCIDEEDEEERQEQDEEQEHQEDEEQATRTDGVYQAYRGQLSRPVAVNLARPTPALSPTPLKPLPAVPAPPAPPPRPARVAAPRPVHVAQLVQAGAPVAPVDASTSFLIP